MEEKEFRPRIAITPGGLTVPEWQAAIKWIESNGLPYQVGDDQESKTTVAESGGPLSVEEMAGIYKINQNLFEATDIRTNKWEVGMKVKKADGTDETITKPLWQTVVKWRLKKAPDYTAIKERIIAEFQESIPQAPYIVTNGGLCVEIVITDHHIGKVPADGLGEWGTKESIEVYNQAIDYFMAEMPTGVTQVILPTGNDFIQVDNLYGTTTKGTRVDASTNWFAMIVAAKKCAQEAIMRLSGIAPVLVPMVAGNHDKNSTLALGEILAAQFAGHPMVEVINTVQDRKYFPFGKSVIGWSHLENFSYKGAAINVLSDLRKVPGAGDAENVYFRVGHLHKSSRVSTFTEKDELFGVEIEVCPTLCPTDQWHDDKGYAGNQRRSTMFIYDQNGLIGTKLFNYNGR